MSNLVKIKNNNYSGILLCTIGSGIYFKPTGEDEPQIINEDLGLSSNTTNTAFVENDSILWIGSNKGLDRVNYDLNENGLKFNVIEKIDKSDGLIGNYVIDIVKWRDEIWVTTKNGITHFKYEEIKKNHNKPKIFLDRISVNGIILDSINNETKFSYSENDFGFRYTGIYYNKNSSQPFYKTALVAKGQDTSWTYTNNRDVQFRDLSPNTYSFLVDACDSKGDYTESPIKYEFSIAKHFSETIGFKILAFVVVGFWGFFFMRIREQYILTRAQQKEELKSAELRAKAAELNALRNQMNPHFIYNSLNSIQNYIFDDDPERANYLLSRFSKLMRSSLKLSELEFITVETEIAFLKNYLELERMRFSDSFEFNIIVDPPKLKSSKIPPLLIQPLMENSIKHGFDGNKGFYLELKITADEAHLHITVTDNGKGFRPPKEDKKRPSALKIIRERITLINHNAERKFSFSISNIADNRLTGTIAHFKIPMTNENNRNR